MTDEPNPSMSPLLQSTPIDALDPNGPTLAANEEDDDPLSNVGALVAEEEEE